MKNTNNNFSIKKICLASIAFCAFMFTGCSEKMANQEAADVDESVVVAEEKEVVDADPVVAVTRYVYMQPVDMQKTDDKVVIDASATSFKALDTDNNKIVNQDEFYKGLFILMDVDKDNMIEETEFMTEENFLTANKDSEISSFAAWDADNNKQITDQELRNKLSSIIDIADGETLAQNLYIVWDTDNDDKIEKLELENVDIRFDQDSN